MERAIGPGITIILTVAFISSRMDYCKAVRASLYRSQESTLFTPLQRVQNASTRPDRST